MYEKYFYLNEKPFHITPDPRFLYLSKNHREAMDLLNFGIKEKKGFIMLSGEVGTGKTTLCRALLEKLPKKVETALILNPTLSDYELLKTITDDFGLRVKGKSVKDHLDRLNGFLLKISAEGGNAVVIIDEAQNLNSGTLEMLRLLSNLETEKEKLLQVILVGQPELRDKLDLPELRQLNQRIIVRCHLNPLDAGETGVYILNRLLVAGGASSVKFDDEAQKLVFKASGGIPRLINIICDRALIAAFVADKRAVNAGVMAEALVDLVREGCLAGDSAGGKPAYAKYIPHIALSTFIIAIMALIFWGPVF
ncbi:MAG: AAA family ATPase [Deltaproteobacteria bacterium]|nr:AAA family ATPase [Deltaproteobacteria bacterium]